MNIDHYKIPVLKLWIWSKDLNNAKISFLAKEKVEEPKFFGKLLYAFTPISKLTHV